MVVGITGHQRLRDEELWDWVRSEIVVALDETPSRVVGLSSLAIGADQLFAKIVLEHGGELRAVIPFAGYERTFGPGDLKDYEELLRSAASVEIVSTDLDEQMAYFEAGSRIVDTCERLIAVWDGEPAKGKGGTGDAVAYARSLSRCVVHIDPNRMVTRRLQD